jgi:hypothetical protein
MVMAASLKPFGYTKSSSSPDRLACELRFDVFSSSRLFSFATLGFVASTAAPVEGTTLSTTPAFSRSDGSWLCVAVRSESAMLPLVEGRRWLFVSAMCESRRIYSKARASTGTDCIWKAEWVEVEGQMLAG